MARRLRRRREMRTRRKPRINPRWNAGSYCAELMPTRTSCFVSARATLRMQSRSLLKKFGRARRISQASGLTHGLNTFQKTRCSKSSDAHLNRAQNAILKSYLVFSHSVVFWGCDSASEVSFESGLGEVRRDSTVQVEIAAVVSPQLFSEAVVMQTTFTRRAAKWLTLF